MTAVHIRPATAADQEDIVALLATNDLPTADVPECIEAFSVFEVEGDQIGAGALVPYDDVALLRSVVIDAEVRNQGFGTTCCRRLLDSAAAQGIEAIYLLTTTAEAFFEDLGFEAVDREVVPAPIRETRLFSELCPTAATAMCYPSDTADSN